MVISVTRRVLNIVNHHVRNTQAPAHLGAGLDIWVLIVMIPVQVTVLMTFVDSWMESAQAACPAGMGKCVMNHVLEDVTWTVIKEVEAARAAYLVE